MGLHPELILLLTAFENSNARYLVIGGWAVSTHAKARYTKDLDLWVGTEPENLTRVITGLREFGVPPGVIANAESLSPEEFMFFGREPNRVDILRTIPGVEFEGAWARRERFRWGEQEVNLIGLNDLIAAKRAAARPRDLSDVKELLKVRR